MLRAALTGAGRRRALPLVLPASAAAAVLTGVLPPRDAGAVLARIWPVLAFLVAVTIVAELADAAGLFELAADVAARAGRGRVAMLWLLVAGLATATTVLLSLDTTAVLLTPVVLALAQRLRLSPLPFALVTLWLANTASLLLPVSNLTNLLAVERTGWSAATWAAHLWLPAATAVVTTVVVAAAWFARSLRGRYDRPGRALVRHRGRLAVAAVACGGLGTGVAAGVPPWIAAGAAALVLLTAFAVTERSRITPGLVPVRLVTGTVSIFLLVAAAERFGLGDVLHRAIGAPGGGPGLGDVLRVTAVGAVAANAVNNLPAYLAIEPHVSSSPVLLAALVTGTNAGPLVTPWASLATLLWLDRCRARGVHVPVTRISLLGAVIAVPVLVATAVVLHASG